MDDPEKLETVSQHLRKICKPFFFEYYLSKLVHYTLRIHFLLEDPPIGYHFQQKVQFD